MIVTRLLLRAYLGMLVKSGVIVVEVIGVVGVVGVVLVVEEMGASL